MKKVAHSSLLADIPCRIFDQSAETLAELTAGCGESYAWMWSYAKDEVAAGRWEQVKKRVNGRVMTAYRRKAQP